jgi:hypothetical protein
MKQLTLINTCFFLYVIISARPVGDRDSTRGFLVLNNTKIDQLIIAPFSHSEALKIEREINQ